MKTSVFSLSISLSVCLYIYIFSRNLCRDKLVFVSAIWAELPGSETALKRLWVIIRKRPSTLPQYATYEKCLQYNIRPTEYIKVVLPTLIKTRIFELKLCYESLNLLVTNYTYLIAVKDGKAFWKYPLLMLSINALYQCSLSMLFINALY